VIEVCSTLAIECSYARQRVDRGVSGLPPSGDGSYTAQPINSRITLPAGRLSVGRPSSV
jgi:hypothetical protein